MQNILWYEKNEGCNEEGYHQAVFDIIKNLKRSDDLSKSLNNLLIGKDILLEKNLEFKHNNKLIIVLHKFIRI